MRTFRYVLLDVFTDTALEGNQLAVFTDARDLDPVTMQALALELNLSETVFVLPPQGDGHVRIRIFTPHDELPFAGHPTLGAAFALAAPLQLMIIRIETGAGVVPVELERGQNGRIVFGKMEQPIPTFAPYERADELLEVLGVSSSLPVEVYDNGVQHVYVACASEDEVASLGPDVSRFGVIGINCFARADEHWKTRMFGMGLREDPATGSAAGPLVVHLCRHGLVPWGTRIELHQGVELGRPSTLYALAAGSDAGIERVEVGGCAVTVARGEFRIP